MAKGEILAVRVQLRQEPGGVAVGGEDLDDGFEVDGLVLAVDGGSLGPVGAGSECAAIGQRYRQVPATTGLSTLL